MYISTSDVIKQLVNAFNCSLFELWRTWEVWTTVKKVEMLVASS